MISVEHARDQAVVARRAFPAASRLHAQVEEQARELHDLRARLGTALAELGQLPPTLRAPSLGPQRHRDPRPPGIALDHPPPAAAPWWPDAPPGREAMRPAPGRRCAGLLDERAPVLAVSFCGKPEAEAAALLEQVVEQQIKTRAFVPLFLTDDARQLHLFRHEGYDVELLPRRAALERCPGAVGPEALLERRLAQIEAAWGVVGWIDMGGTKLPDLPRPAVRPAAAQSATAGPTLVFYKDYRRHNPYQHLLYASLPRIQALAGDVEAAIVAAGSGPTLFHVNWEEAVYRDAATPAAAMDLALAFLGRLDVLAAAGGKVVWTLHNSEPHDNPFPLAYRALAGGIAQRSGLVIVHSLAAAALAAERHGLCPERLCHVPHGGYHALYEGGRDRAAARLELGLPANGLVLGFVGNVRPYKNVPLLLDAFGRLPRGSAHLLLAGRQQPTLDLSGVDPAVLEAVVVRDQVIEEAVLPAHLVACDAVVLPFDRILTSGSLMLALSLEVPVIVPAVASLREVVADGENGLLFEPNDAASLARAMHGFGALDGGERRAMRAAAGQTARLADWGWIGRKVRARLASLLAEG